MDKAVLQKWLKSGYVENGVTYRHAREFRKVDHQSHNFKHGA